MIPNEGESGQPASPNEPLLPEALTVDVQLRRIAEHIDDVRARVFGPGTSRQQMATLLGLPGYRQYGALINPESRANNATYTKVLQAWASRGVAEGDRQKLLALLTAQSHGIQRFYDRLAFEVGHTEFQTRTSVKHLASRQQRGVFPDYLEPLGVVDDLFPGEEHAERRSALRAEADAIWTAQCAGRYTERRVEPFFARFLTALEKRCRCDGHPYDAATLQHHYGLTQEQAAHMVNAELPLWRGEIEVLGERVLSKDGCATFDGERSLKDAWGDAEARGTPRRSFEREFWQACDEQGIAAPDMARCLQAGEPRTDESLNATVRATVERCCNSQRAPAIVLVALASGGTSRQARLLELFRAAREEHERRSGSAVYGSGCNAFGMEISIECDLAGLTLDDVARELTKDAIGNSDRAARRAAVDRLKQIQLGAIAPASAGQEEAENALLPAEQQRIREAIRRMGQAKIDVALARRKALESATAASEELPAFHGVAHAVSVLIDAAGSPTALADILRASTAPSAATLMLSHTRLFDIAEGLDVPPWPYIEHLFVAAQAARGWELQERIAVVRNDWLRAYPQHLIDREQLPGAGTPLPRILRTVIALEASSLQAFAQRNRISYKVLQRQIAALEAGQPMTVAAVERILRAAGCTSRSPIWQVAVTAARDPSQTLFALSDSRIDATHPPLRDEYPGLLDEEYTMAKIERPA